MCLVFGELLAPSSSLLLSYCSITYECIRLQVDNCMVFAYLYYYQIIKVCKYQLSTCSLKHSYMSTIAIVFKQTFCGPFTITMPSLVWVSFLVDFYFVHNSTQFHLCGSLRWQRVITSLLVMNVRKTSSVIRLVPGKQG